MFFSNTPRPESLRAIADVKLTPFWLDDPHKPEKTNPLTNKINAELVIIGGGFTGLWTALLAKQANPNREVVLLEAGEVAVGASGRNGGFCSASLTHSFQNGLNRWENELRTLIQMGHQNLDEIEATIKQYNIDCDFIRSGEFHVANEPYQIEDLIEEVEQANQYGEHYQFLNQEQIQKKVHSSSYLVGMFDPSVAILNPVQLAWGLRRVCLELGVKLFESTQVTSLVEKRDTKRVIVKTEYGEVESKKVAL